MCYLNNNGVDRMEIKNESDFNAQTVRALRDSLGMSQREFWGAVCISIARGSAYEIERNKIPAPVKRLLYLQYIAGVSVDNQQGETVVTSRTKKALITAQATIDNALRELK